MTIKIEHDPALAARCAELRTLLRQAEAAFSADTIRRTGLAVGDVLRDPDTGCTYRVESAQAWPHVAGAGPRIYIEGRRIYSTGRTPARRTSAIDMSRLERIEPNGDSQ